MRARSACSAWTSAPTPSELHERVGIQLQTSELPDKIYVREALELFASFYPDPVEPDELLQLLGLEEKARHPLRQPLRRAAPAALDRARAGRPSRARDPRRADHRPRPAVAPRDLEADRGHPRPGPDGDPRHALHGGGRVSLRPRGAAAPRSHPRDRHPRQPRRGPRSADQLPRHRGARPRQGARAARGARGPASRVAAS